MSNNSAKKSGDRTDNADVFSILVHWVMTALLAVVPACAFFSVIKTASGFPEVFNVTDIPVMLLVVAAYFAVYHFTDFRKWSAPRFIITSCVIANAVMVASLLWVDTLPAHCLPYQETLYYRFGVQALTFQISNLLIINLSMLLTYIVALRSYGQRTALYALLLMSVFLPVLLTVNQYSHEHLMLVVILCILLSIQREGWVAWGLGGLAASVCLQPQGWAVMLTVGIYGIYQALKTDSWRWVLNAVVFVAVMQTAALATDALLYAQTSVEAPETASQACTVQDLALKAIRYIGGCDHKFETTFTGSDPVTGGYPVRALAMTGWTQYIILAFLGTYGLWRRKAERRLSAVELLYICITCAYILTHALAGGRYITYPVIMMMAGVGAQYLETNQNTSKRTNKRKR